MKILIFTALVAMAAASNEVRMQQLTERIDKINELQHQFEDTISDLLVGSYAPDDAFTARPNSNDGVYEAQDVIAFNSTLYNQNGNYNQTSYEYICPTSGYYLFAATVDVSVGNFFGDIVKRAAGTTTVQTIGELYAVQAGLNGTQVAGRDNGHITTMVECGAGDAVYVTAGVHCVGCRLTSQSRFTGTKLGNV